jgi:hypothetical protein
MLQHGKGSILAQRTLQGLLTAGRDATMQSPAAAAGDMQHKGPAEVAQAAHRERGGDEDAEDAEDAGAAEAAPRARQLCTRLLQHLSRAVSSSRAAAAVVAQHDASTRLVRDCQRAGAAGERLAQARRAQEKSTAMLMWTFGQPVVATTSARQDEQALEQAGELATVLLSLLAAQKTEKESVQKVRDERGQLRGRLAEWEEEGQQLQALIERLREGEPAPPTLLRLPAVAPSCGHACLQ